MTDPKDPEGLLTAYHPAILQLADGGEQFVAHRRYTDGGWIHTIEWDGSARDWSPVAVESVQPVETETTVTETGAGTQAIVDDGLCERARRLAGTAELRADGGQFKDARHRSPWEAPDCRSCDALHIYVDRSSDGQEWRCHKCGESFRSRADYRVARPDRRATVDRGTTGLAVDHGGRSP